MVPNAKMLMIGIHISHPPSCHDATLGGIGNGRICWGCSWRRLWTKARGSVLPWYQGCNSMINEINLIYMSPYAHMVYYIVQWGYLERLEGEDIIDTDLLGAPSPVQFVFIQDSSHRSISESTRIDNLWLIGLVFALQATLPQLMRWKYSSVIKASQGIIT